MKYVDPISSHLKHIKKKKRLIHHTYTPEVLVLASDIFLSNLKRSLNQQKHLSMEIGHSFEQAMEYDT